MRVAVVGAGVIGVTAAVAVKEAFPLLDVTIFSEAFTPHTTGDGSAGLWGPYILGDTNPKKIVQWSLSTHKWMENFWKSGLAAEVGVCLIPFYRVASDPQGYATPPEWLSVVYGAHPLTKDDLKRLNEKNQSNYTGGLHFLTYTCEPARFLPYLMKKFKSMNGQVVARKITDLKRLKSEGYDVVINCTGLGARELLDDKSVIPVRGQVMRIKAPYLFEGTLEDDHPGNYVIPNYDTVVLGGTHQEGDFNCSVNQTDTTSIREGCERICPSIKKSETLKEWVGLRPSRSTVRLEPQIIKTPGETDFIIIHNYGHGGSGITLSWGCALDVVEILRQQLKIKNLSKL